MFASGKMLMTGANYLGFSFADSDAEAYVAAVEATGVTVNDNQKAAIDNWFVGTKADGIYASVKISHLTIWGSAVANAINMITPASSSTWNGSVTHGTGYVEGNGTTGYLATGVTPTVAGWGAADSLMAFFLQSENYDGNTSYHSSAGNCIVNALGTIGSPSIDVSPSDGGISGSGYQSGGCHVALWTASNVQIRGLRTGGTDARSGDPNGANPNSALEFMRYSTLYSTQKYGMFGAGAEINVTQAENLNARNKTLWETCTGLALP